MGDARPMPWARRYLRLVAAVAVAGLLLSGRPLAGKTGTTSGFTDAWFTGFAPQLATSVWVGQARAQVPMDHLFGGGPVYGGTFPALIFHNYMAAALAGAAPARAPGPRAGMP